MAQEEQRSAAIAVRVLVAGQDGRMRQALRTLLEANPGFEVVAEAATVAEVIAYEAIHAPTVIVLDLILPQAEDGLHLLRRLATMPERRTVAICVRGGLRCAALQAGACTFLEMGANPDELIEAVRSAALPRH